MSILQVCALSVIRHKYKLINKNTLFLDTTCQLWSQNHSLCYLHNSQKFGNIVNILSASLSLVAVILEFIILFFVKDLELYGDNDDSESNVVELLPISTIGNAPDGNFHIKFMENFEEKKLIRIYVVISAAPQVVSTEPLLSDQERAIDTSDSQNEPPLISAPIPVTTESSAVYTGTIPRVKQSLTSRFVSANYSNSSSLRYSPVYKNTENHIEELNFRLKSLNRVHDEDDVDGEAAGSQALPSDINPSVGSDNEKESELNIRQLESSVSSLSGLPSSVNSPEDIQNRRHAGVNWRVERYETNF